MAKKKATKTAPRTKKPAQPKLYTWRVIRPEGHTEELVSAHDINSYGGVLEFTRYEGKDGDLATRIFGPDMWLDAKLLEDTLPPTDDVPVAP